MILVASDEIASSHYRTLRALVWAKTPTVKSEIPFVETTKSNSISCQKHGDDISDSTNYLLPICPLPNTREIAGHKTLCPNSHAPMAPQVQLHLLRPLTHDQDVYQHHAANASRTGCSEILDFNQKYPTMIRPTWQQRNYAMFPIRGHHNFAAFLLALCTAAASCRGDTTEFYRIMGCLLTVPPGCTCHVTSTNFQLVAADQCQSLLPFWFVLGSPI